MKTALLVVDVQSYFLQKSPKDLPAKIASHIRESNYELVVFTVFQNRDGSNWERSLAWSNCKDDKDLQLAPELQRIADKDKIFVKHTYSALKSDNLENLLRKHSIRKINLCGIDLEACVLATAYDAFDKGYEVEVLFDLSHSRAGLDAAARSIILRDIQTKNATRPH